MPGLLLKRLMPLQNNIFESSLPEGCTPSAIRHGAVIAYPTEGVWGLGCDPDHEAAVRRILSLKQRHEKQGLILVAASIAQFDIYLRDLRAEHRQWLEGVWPGAVTVLVPHYGRCPRYLCGEHSTIALRVSAHPVVSALCHWLGGPLVSTSANRSGQPSLLSASGVQAEFKDMIDFIIPGALGGQVGPSEIVDLQSGDVLRAREQ